MTQPRAIASNEEVLELAASIAEHGLISPMLLERKDDRPFRRLAGYRRFLAMTRVLRWPTLPCIVRMPAGDLERALVALVENVQREHLTHYEVARAIRNPNPEP